MLKLLSKEEILLIHKTILDNDEGFNPDSFEHGKLDGVLGRIESTLIYSEQQTNAFDLAAIYADCIARGHALPDGNKRTAFVSAISVLIINLGHEHNIPLGSIDSYGPELINNIDKLQNASFITEFMVLVAEGKLEREEIRETFLNLFTGTVIAAGIAAIGLGMFALIDFLAKTFNKKK